MIFQQPNFFGCLEPAPDLAAAANDAGALPVAHVDPVSLGVLEAPGNYGCAIAIGEGQGAGNYHVVRRPALRLPRRTRGLHPPDAGPDRRRDDRHRRASAASSSRCRPASSTSAARRRPRTSRRTRRCSRSAGSCYLTWLGPAGAARGGGDLHGARRVREGAAGAAGVELAFPEQATFKEFAVRVGRSGREVVAAARERGVHPGYALGRDYEGMDDALLVAVTEKRTPADIDRLARCSPRWRMTKLIYERSQAGPPRVERSRARACPCPRCRPSSPRGAAAPARGRRAGADPPLHRALDPQLRDRHRLLPARLLHDEVQPAHERARRRAARLPRPPPAAGGGRRPGRARADVAAAGDPRRGCRPRRGLAPAGRRLAGRADRADAHARVLRATAARTSSAARSSSPTPRTARTRRA